ncbi:conserved hypothetical protein [Rippkaea orientalis PCC 8801]|uniref:Uncharacterized protein n=1 Tax=Rippkaea orientalis (strain PCC 8801 / RF-1) TaxID=41431 RepID=B7JYV7_RIPO1|nr:hypothetical protein [Rippkaea orientalis]ACK66034.1 conserved hypothetical protein [Rippkaea orientalis PCC 8801]
MAQPYSPNPESFPNSNSVVIPAGTLIPVRYNSSELIRIELDQYLPLELNVAANIRDRNGNLLIPAGTRIIGQLQPTDGGSQFVAREIILSDGQWLPLDATSNVIYTSETVNEGATVANILSGTFAGAGTATIIAGTTGDRKIAPLEVLGGAALGTLLGWGLPEGQIIGGGSKQLIVIDPNRDLTLTLQSGLAVSPMMDRQSIPIQSHRTFYTSHSQSIW